MQIEPVCLSWPEPLGPSDFGPDHVPLWKPGRSCPRQLEDELRPDSPEQMLARSTTMQNARLCMKAYTIASQPDSKHSKFSSSLHSAAAHMKVQEQLFHEQLMHACLSAADLNLARAGLVSL